MSPGLVLIRCTGVRWDGHTAGGCQCMPHPTPAFSCVSFIWFVWKSVLLEGRRPSSFLRKSPENDNAESTPNSKIFHWIKRILAPVQSARRFFPLSTKCWLFIGVLTYKISCMICFTTEFKGAWIDSRFSLIARFAWHYVIGKMRAKLLWRQISSRPMPLVTRSRNKLCLVRFFLSFQACNSQQRCNYFSKANKGEFYKKNAS